MSNKENRLASVGEDEEGWVPGDKADFVEPDLAAKLLTKWNPKADKAEDKEHTEAARRQSLAKLQGIRSKIGLWENKNATAKPAFSDPALPNHGKREWPPSATTSAAEQPHKRAKQLPVAAGTTKPEPPRYADQPGAATIAEPTASCAAASSTDALDGKQSPSPTTEPSAPSAAATPVLLTAFEAVGASAAGAEESDRKAGSDATSRPSIPGALPGQLALAGQLAAAAALRCIQTAKQPATEAERGSGPGSPVQGASKAATCPPALEVATAPTAAAASGSLTCAAVAGTAPSKDVAEPQQGQHASLPASAAEPRAELEPEWAEPMGSEEGHSSDDEAAWHDAPEQHEHPAERTLVLEAETSQASAGASEATTAGLSEAERSSVLEAETSHASLGTSEATTAGLYEAGRSSVLEAETSQAASWPFEATTALNEASTAAEISQTAAWASEATTTVNLNEASTAAELGTGQDDAAASGEDALESGSATPANAPVAAAEAVALPAQPSTCSPSTTSTVSDACSPQFSSPVAATVVPVSPQASPNGSSLPPVSGSSPQMSSLAAPTGATPESSVCQASTDDSSPLPNKAGSSRRITSPSAAVSLPPPSSPPPTSSPDRDGHQLPAAHDTSSPASSPWPAAAAAVEPLESPTTPRASSPYAQAADRSSPSPIAGSSRPLLSASPSISSSEHPAALSSPAPVTGQLRGASTIAVLGLTPVQAPEGDVQSPGSAAAGVNAANMTMAGQQAAQPPTPVSLQKCTSLSEAEVGGRSLGSQDVRELDDAATPLSGGPPDVVGSPAPLDLATIASAMQPGGSASPAPVGSAASTSPADADAIASNSTACEGLASPSNMPPAAAAAAAAAPFATSPTNSPTMAEADAPAQQLLAGVVQPFVDKLFTAVIASLDAESSTRAAGVTSAACQATCQAATQQEPTVPQASCLDEEWPPAAAHAEAASPTASISAKEETANSCAAVAEAASPSSTEAHAGLAAQVPASDQCAATAGVAVSQSGAEAAQVVGPILEELLAAACQLAAASAEPALDPSAENSALAPTAGAAVPAEDKTAAEVPAGHHVVAAAPAEDWALAAVPAEGQTAVELPAGHQVSAAAPAEDGTVAAVPAEGTPAANVAAGHQADATMPAAPCIEDLTLAEVIVHQLVVTALEQAAAAAATAAAAHEKLGLSNAGSVTAASGVDQPVATMPAAVSTVASLNSISIARDAAQKVASMTEVVHASASRADEAMNGSAISKISGSPAASGVADADDMAELAAEVDGRATYIDTPSCRLMAVPQGVANADKSAPLTAEEADNPATRTDAPAVPQSAVPPAADGSIRPGDSGKLADAATGLDAGDKAIVRLLVASIVDHVVTADLAHNAAMKPPTATAVKQQRRSEADPTAAELAESAAGSAKPAAILPELAPIASPNRASREAAAPNSLLADPEMPSDAAECVRCPSPSIAFCALPSVRAATASQLAWHDEIEPAAEPAQGGVPSPKASSSGPLTPAPAQECPGAGSKNIEVHLAACSSPSKDPEVPCAWGSRPAEEPGRLRASLSSPAHQLEDASDNGTAAEPPAFSSSSPSIASLKAAAAAQQAWYLEPDAAAEDEPALGEPAATNPASLHTCVAEQLEAPDAAADEPALDEPPATSAAFMDACAYEQQQEQKPPMAAQATAEQSPPAKASPIGASGQTAASRCGAAADQMSDTPSASPGAATAEAVALDEDAGQAGDESAVDSKGSIASSPITCLQTAAAEAPASPGDSGKDAAAAGNQISIPSPTIACQKAATAEVAASLADSTAIKEVAAGSSNSCSASPSSAFRKAGAVGQTAEHGELESASDEPPAARFNASPSIASLRTASTGQQAWHQTPETAVDTTAQELSALQCASPSTAAVKAASSSQHARPQKPEANIDMAAQRTAPTACGSPSIAALKAAASGQKAWCHDPEAAADSTADETASGADASTAGQGAGAAIGAAGAELVPCGSPSTAHQASPETAQDTTAEEGQQVAALRVASPSIAALKAASSSQQAWYEDPQADPQAAAGMAGEAPPVAAASPSIASFNAATASQPACCQGSTAGAETAAEQDPAAEPSAPLGASGCKDAAASTPSITLPSARGYENVENNEPNVSTPGPAAGALRTSCDAFKFSCTLNSVFSPDVGAAKRRPSHAAAVDSGCPEADALNSGGHAPAASHAAAAAAVGGACDSVRKVVHVVAPAGHAAAAMPALHQPEAAAAEARGCLAAGPVTAACKSPAGAALGAGAAAASGQPQTQRPAIIQPNGQLPASSRPAALLDKAPLAAFAAASDTTPLAAYPHSASRVAIPFHLDVGLTPGAGMPDSPALAAARGSSMADSPAFNPNFAQDAVAVLGSLRHQTPTPASATEAAPPAPGAVGDQPVTGPATADAEQPAQSLARGAKEPAVDDSLVSVKALKAKLAEALSQVAELQRDKADYLPLLESYWVANEALRDQQSEAATSWQTKLALSEMRAQKVLSEKAKVEKQFKQLYREKYLPLKEHFAASKEAVEKLTAQHSAAAAVMEQLRSQLATAELKLRKAGIDQQSTLQQLAQAQDLIQAQGQTIVERDNALAEAAKALEQMRAQAGRAAVYQAEVEALATQNGLLQQKMDEAVHRVNAVKQARDRATQGMLAKEEEICDLQVKLRERDVKLAELKRETERFAESKQRCKGEAAAYEAKLQEKATENAMLLKMCDQLMTEMEKAGMAVPM